MLEIYRSSTFYKFKCTVSGQLFDYNFDIRGYMRRLTQSHFNPRLRRWVIDFRYATYDMEENYLLMPINNLPHFVEQLNKARIPNKIIDMAIPPGDEVFISMNPDMIDREKQIKPIEYLATDPSPMRGLSLQTGVGKTYCAIKAISLLGRRAMIFTKGLVNQWYDEIMDKTELMEDEVYIIQGIDSIAKLCKKDLFIDPKIYIASISTIKNHILRHKKHPYNQYPDFNQLLKMLGIGTRVTDEVHLNFSANVIIDLHSEILHNIYLSATYERSDADGKKIFNIVYPPSMRYGEGQIKRYVNITSYAYDIGYIPPNACMTQRGYSHSKYENHLLKKKTKGKTWVQNVLRPLITSHYLNVKKPGQKILILVSTINMGEYVLDALKDYCREYDLTSTLYVSGSDDEDLITHDVIVSTPGSAGTGTDIKNLRSMINTISFRSSPLSKQTLGRLRELPNGDIPEFVYIHHRGIDAHNRHAFVRRPIYQMHGLTFTELSL